MIVKEYKKSLPKLKSECHNLSRMNIFDFLSQHQIEFERFDHPPVFTYEQAKQLLANKLLPIMPGVETKNLFLRNRKGERHFLVSVPAPKMVDLKALAKVLESDRLSMASPERLMQHLGVEPGSVTLLGLINDKAQAVKVLLDTAIWEAEAVQCHPLVNSATLIIKQPDLRRFLAFTGHTAKVMAVPSL